MIKESAYSLFPHSILLSNKKSSHGLPLRFLNLPLFVNFVFISHKVLLEYESTFSLKNHQFYSQISSRSK